jgi:hypothetical protein
VGVEPTTLTCQHLFIGANDFREKKRIIAKRSYFLVVDDVVDDGIIVVAICTFYIINMKHFTYIDECTRNA